MTSISIITPTIGRNSLRPMLQRVLVQLQDGDEVLVVGDGPQANAKKIVDEFKHALVRYWESEPIHNYGNPQRNTAVEEAKGDYLLFVDDDASVRRTLVRLLQAMGHTAWEADSGKAALAHLASTAVDMIVSDLGMPEMNGLDFARAVRVTHPTTPILLCTGWNDLADHDDLASGLITEILQKPVTLKRLQDAIARHNPRAGRAARP